MNFIDNFFHLFAMSAPWLLLGLLMAGLIHLFLSADKLANHLGRSDLPAVIKAALVGAPLPLCSCGVIPAAIGLRRSGASRPATVSFLVATPETGVDSVSISWALLGPVFAIIRPVSAIFSAFLAGTMTLLFGDSNLFGDSRTGTKQTKAKDQTSVGHSCCHSSDKSALSAAPVEQPATPEVSASCCQAKQATTENPIAANREASASRLDAGQHQNKHENSCCHSEQPRQAENRGRQQLKEMFQYATGKLLSDFTLWLLIGLLLAAAIKTWLPVHWLTDWGQGPLALLVMALIGVPMYICATASTPMAAGFLAAGVSPGAVLVFMLAGPATNLSTMGMIRQEMGSRVLVIYLVSVLLSSIGLGYLVNLWFEPSQMAIPAFIREGAEASLTPLEIVSALLLAGLMVRNFIRTYKSN